jgi:carbon-monoxide dehydrogenase medium subunit
LAIAHEFEYHKPSTVEEAVDLLAAYGTRARVLAGGTDLVFRIRTEHEEPDAVVDVKGIPGLDAIEVTDEALTIGALVTFNEVIESDSVRSRFPVLGEMASKVGSFGLRNRATLVGNVCSAVPCCDSGPVLFVLGAEVAVRGLEGERRVPIGEWFVANRTTSIAEGEMVTGLVIPLPAGDQAGCYVKLGRYRGEDLAQASVAVLARPENRWRVAFGAVAPTPVHAPAIEERLEGNVLSDLLLEEAAGLVESQIRPITDVRATREYRLHMSRVMLGLGLKAAAARLAGEGPAYGARLF